MNFKDPITLLFVLTGSCFLLVGILMMIFPSKEINSFFGYRSKRSKFNKQKWDLAQRYSSRRLIESGFLMLTFCLVSQVLNMEIVFWMQIAMAAFAVVFTFVNVLFRTEFQLRRMR